MKDRQGFSYQIYETYFQKAKEAYAAKRMTEAKKMYLNSAQSLLRSAKDTDGEMKEALIRRAEKIVRLADTIPEISSCEISELKNGSDIQITKSEPHMVSQENKEKEEGETNWKRSGSPGVYFDDIAGLQDVKESIRTRVILPRLHPEIYDHFRRKVEGGILLYGPPGTGKTMIAKAIATEIDAEFYSVRCSDIVGKYFGEAEKNIRRLFDTARKSKSSIIFFDEFEALAIKRGGHSTVMNRLVPELLSQMDGFCGTEENHLLILAATNRPWDIDSAFLRPPRLTQKIYVGLPDYEARHYLAEKAFLSVPCQVENISDLIAKATQGCNAADVAAVCGSIKDNAIRYAIENGQSGGMIRAEDVETALQNYHSSVQQSDLDQIRHWEKLQGNG